MFSPESAISIIIIFRLSYVKLMVMVMVKLKLKLKGNDTVKQS